jgi:hypothetical protein
MRFVASVEELQDRLCHMQPCHFARASVAGVELYGAADAVQKLKIMDTDHMLDRKDLAFVNSMNIELGVTWAHVISCD